jgi:hypothetical protein
LLLHSCLGPSDFSATAFSLFTIDCYQGIGDTFVQLMVPALLVKIASW